jgi:hypothetical protein
MLEGNSLRMYEVFKLYLYILHMKYSTCNVKILNLIFTTIQHNNHVSTKKSSINYHQLY